MDREEMADATLRIAQEYATSQNLDIARQQLAELDVANVNQWLLYVADTHTAEGGDEEGERVLTDLVNALGLNSTSVAVSADGEASGVAVVADSAADDTNTTDATDLDRDASVSADANTEESTQQVVVVADLANADTDGATDGTMDGTTDGSESESASTSSAASSDALPVIEIAPVESSESSAEETPQQAASVTASNGMNVRSGPGLAYPIIGAMQTSESAEITGKNPQGDWWQVTLATGQQGWVYSPLVTTAGDTASVAVAANIPTPPPATPTVEAVAVAPAAEESSEAPAEEAPAEEAPAEEAAPPAGNNFVLIERRLWGPEENGGRMDGESVVCGEKRQLQVHVLDAGGAPLDGISVQVLYGNKEIEVTGAQGKGDGIAEFILGDGQDVTVIKDTDGRDVSSDVASNLTTKPYAIDFNDLIQAGYCTDAASCQKNVVDVYACGGHYSWTVKFQRSY